MRGEGDWKCCAVAVGSYVDDIFGWFWAEVYKFNLGLLDAGEMYDVNGRAVVWARSFDGVG